MLFLTVPQRKNGTETYARQTGPLGEFFAFDYEISCDPTVEGVGVQLSPDVIPCAAWDYEPDIHAGARVGWEDALYDDAVRLCCTKIHVLRTRDNPVDTSPAVVRLLLISFVRKLITVWGEHVQRLRPEWLTSDAIALARGIHTNAALDGIPALTDALLEAGCDDPLVMEHLRSCPDHGPSCWVVEMILDALKS